MLVANMSPSGRPTWVCVHTPNTYQTMGIIYLDKRAWLMCLHLIFFSFAPLTILDLWTQGFLGSSSFHLPSPTTSSGDMWAFSHLDILPCYYSCCPRAQGRRGKWNSCSIICHEGLHIWAPLNGSQYHLFRSWWMVTMTNIQYFYMRFVFYWHASLLLQFMKSLICVNVLFLVFIEHLIVIATNQNVTC